VHVHTGSKSHTSTSSVALTPGLQQYYGHIVSLTKANGSYLMTFDPEWFLTGITANAAAAADSHVACTPASCEPVPNDNYSVDESNRTYVFRVPAGVTGTVLTSGANLSGAHVSVAQLAAIVAGQGMKLFEPLDSGVWIRVRIDTVTSFQQQYHP
jgi:aspartate/methionine/tyrosine aminotransferase